MSTAPSNRKKNILQFLHKEIFIFCSRHHLCPLTSSSSPSSSALWFSVNSVDFPSKSVPSSCAELKEDSRSAAASMETRSSEASSSLFASRVQTTQSTLNYSKYEKKYILHSIYNWIYCLRVKLWWMNHNAAVIFSFESIPSEDSAYLGWYLLGGWLWCAQREDSSQYNYTGKIYTGTLWRHRWDLQAPNLLHDITRKIHYSLPLKKTNPLL